MLDPIALIEAQRLTRDLAQGALPEASTVVDSSKVPPAERWAPVRARLSQQLRRLADLVEPAPLCGQVPTAERR